MAEKRVMTLRLEPELRRRIDGLAKAQRRSRSFIAAEAIRQYIAVNEWQIEEMVFTGTPYIREDRVEVLRVFHTARSGRQICESRYSRSVHRLAAFFYRRRTSNSRNVAADNAEKRINRGDKTAFQANEPDDYEPAVRFERKFGQQVQNS